MAILNIDVPLFKKMVMNGAINLKNNHQEVDELNVFPVPDGDTGTNMQMTVMGGVREMNNCRSNSIVEVAKSLSRGCLMGARGNSGVILSQFFRGLYVGIKDLNKDTLDINDFLATLISGYKVAYKAVMEPVEGTILTVVREAAENTELVKGSFKSINALVEYYLDEARKSLENTPNLLPVLKEAGVVDSGGAGFIKIVEGMALALEGKMLEADEHAKDKKETTPTNALEFTYCVEFIAKIKRPESFQSSDVKAPLSILGNDLLFVQNGDLIKVHIHTNSPGRVLEIAQKFGDFDSVKIDNLYKQHTELKNGARDSKENEKPKKHFALISVCFGEGISSTFKDLGVDYIVEGGQTMNPSTKEFVKAVQEVNADNVIIIPNNSNVIMAAEQAIPLCEGINVQVLKAKTIAQGYASLMVYDQNADMDTNILEMTTAVAHVQSGEVTYSIRDTEIKGVKIVSGDYMGIANGEIVVSTTSRIDATKELLKNILGEDSEIVTIFYGQDVTSDEVDTIAAACEEIMPGIDVELIEGKQDIYSYIIAVE